MQLSLYLRLFLCFKCDLSLDAIAVSALISSMLTILGVLLGAKYQTGKGKAKQLTQLLTTIIAAAEDDAVSEEEFKGIVSLAKALMSSSVSDSGSASGG